MKTKRRSGPAPWQMQENLPRDDSPLARVGGPIVALLALIFLLMLLGLAGCAAASQTSFRQGLASAGDFDRDSAECEMRGEENRSSGGYYGLIGAITYSESYGRVYDACMRAKGYERAQ